MNDLELNLLALTLTLLISDPTYLFETWKYDKDRGDEYLLEKVLQPYMFFFTAGSLFVEFVQ